MIIACAVCATRNRVPLVAFGIPRCGSCHRALPWLVEATETDFAVVIETRALVLVDLWAPWCGSCRTMSPLIDRIAADLAGRLKVVKVNVDASPGISSRFGVQSIPTLLLVRHGVEVSRRVGALSAQALRTWIEAELVDPPP